MTRSCAGCTKPLHWTTKGDRCRSCHLQQLNRGRALPDDFTIHAPVERNLDLMERYDASLEVVSRWRRITGIKAPASRVAVNVIPMPDAFALIAPTCTRKQLCARYGRSRETIDRWCRVAKVTPLRARTGPVASAADRTFGSPRVIVHRDHSQAGQAGQAADFLRKFGPVYRCDEKGRPRPAGTHWSRAGYVLSADEIIDRAVRNGWNPNAWREVA